MVSFSQEPTFKPQGSQNEAQHQSRFAPSNSPGHLTLEPVQYCPDVVAKNDEALLWKEMMKFAEQEAKKDYAEETGFHKEDWKYTRKRFDVWASSFQQSQEGVYQGGR